MRERRRPFVQQPQGPPASHFIVALVVPLLLYARVTTFDYVRADDVDLIRDNQTFLGELSNVPRAFTQSYFETQGPVGGSDTYYRPLAIISFMLDAQWSGGDPRGYHLTNVVLHGLVCALLLLLATRWGGSRRAALVALLVFATHPVNVHAVAWIAARNELLLTGFGLLSLIAWSRASASHARAAWWIAVHTLSFAAALFSKETGLVFPVLAALHQRVVLQTGVSRTQWLGLGIDGLVILFWAGLRAEALAGSPAVLIVERLETVALNSPQLLVQTGKLVAPVRLNVAPGVDWIGIGIGLAAVAGLAWMATRVWSRRDAVLAGCWWVAFLAPPLLVRGLPAYEHRNYLPLAGLLLTASVSVSRLDAPASRATRRAGERSARRGAYPRILRPLNALSSTIAVGVVVASFAARTYTRQDVYRDPFAYWADATRGGQYAPFAHINLGQLHEGAGRLAEAQREYRRALDINPNVPKAHNNLGVVMMKINEPERAAWHFNEEVRLHPANAEAWFNLGLAAERQGDSERASRYYQRAIQENGAFRPAYEKLGLDPLAIK